MSGAREAESTDGERATTRLTERQLWELAAGNDVDLDLDDGSLTVRVGAPPAPCPDRNRD
ncbi:hypothetical protein [Natronomonas sp. EA1]|uniref:hypothetical protein n=1 Tax=Natronomonas sp. EA1 TaxID=3421655 RepID=UPI003EC11DB4